MEKFATEAAALRANLQEKDKHCSALSKEIQAEFERKKLEWMGLERGYSMQIGELESWLFRLFLGNSEKIAVVSIDAYLLEVWQTHHYK